jgi:hypothetical protein
MDDGVLLDIITREDFDKKNQSSYGFTSSVDQRG